MICDSVMFGMKVCRDRWLMMNVGGHGEWWERWLDMLSHVWCHIKRTVPPCHYVVNYLIDITKKNWIDKNW